jgi:hypothetical protein
MRGWKKFEEDKPETESSQASWRSVEFEGTIFAFELLRGCKGR